jgi:hypothetical protein
MSTNDLPENIERQLKSAGVWRGRPVSVAGDYTLVFSLFF